MSHDPRSVAVKRIVYTTSGIDAVRVRRDVAYHATASDVLTADFYYPADVQPGSNRPAVVLVAGYSDAGAQRMLGCRFKETGAFVSWAQAVAAAGLVAITYANRVAADVDFLLEFLERQADLVGVDAARVGLWACSGHAPTALALLMNQRWRFRCAALLYPYTIDIAGSTGVIDASAQFRFASVPAHRSAADLPRDVALFLARAGRDEMPDLNAALDRFVEHALSNNIPLTLVNHATAPHAFDLFDDTAATRAVIDETVRFLTIHLT